MVANEISEVASATSGPLWILLCSESFAIQLAINSAVTLAAAIRDEPSSLIGSHTDTVLSGPIKPIKY